MNGPGPGDEDVTDEHEHEESDRFERSRNPDDPLDPSNRKDERRAYVQRKGFAITPLTGEAHGELHGPAVAFLNAHHEKRVRKTSREWFAATTPEDHEASGCALYAAVIEGQVLGVTAANDSGYASGFTVVHPDYRRMGVGTALMRQKLVKVPSYTTRVAVDNESCLYLMFKTGLVATTIAKNEANGKTVIRFETSSGRKGTVPVGPRDPAMRDPSRIKNTKPTWAVVSALPLKKVESTAQLMVVRAASVARDGTITVHHGKKVAEYGEKNKLDGLYLYRDEARAAKRQWAEDNGKTIAKWEDVIGTTVGLPK
jgi:GNAT superfamily N-acetyltransferase